MNVQRCGLHIYIYMCVYKYTHKMECYPAIKKQNNEKNAILATLMDLEMIILNEVSQKKTDSI